MCSSSFSFLSLGWSSSSLSLAEWEGRRRWCCFGKTRPQGRRSPRLSTATPWPLATSVIVMVHIWFHRQQTALCSPIPWGHPAALSPLCIIKQGSLCALGSSFVLHSAMPRSITSFQRNCPNSTQGQSPRVLPSCFPSPGKCGSCMRARVTTHQHFLSKSSCCLLQSFPLPDPEPQEKRGC